MNEIAVVFGSERNLVGTLSLPSEGSNQKVGFILLNAGVIHRIGPHRFNVKLARALVRQGFTTLRMDLSGQGDSRRPAQPGAFASQAVHDLRQAMDHLSRISDIHHFVIAGICSGAINGTAAALADPRVVGLWMLDTFAYPTRKTHWVRYQRQLQAKPLATLASWSRLALRKVGDRLGLREATSTAPPGPVGNPVNPEVDFGQQVPARHDFAQQLQTLHERGVHLYLVHSGSMLWFYNHASQFRDAFAAYPFAKVARCDYKPHIDHTMTALSAQREMIDAICAWAPGVKAPT